MPERIELTPSQHRRCNRLIKRLCANYDDGNCLLLDDGESCVCPQTISYSLLCRYFRNAVLPAEKELYADIFKQRTYCLLYTSPYCRFSLPILHLQPLRL